VTTGDLPGGPVGVPVDTAVDAPVDAPVGRFRNAVHTTFFSLRNRNFRLYFSGQIVSQTGNWLNNVALTLLVLHLTGSGAAVGALTVAQFAPILLLSPVAGALADRSDKRKLLMITQTLSLTQSAVLAALAFMPDPSLVALFVTATIGGIVLSLDNPLRRSIITDLVPTEDRANAVALNSALMNVSRVFGPALAGLLVVTVGYGWCFTVDATSFVFVLVALALMRPAELHRTLAPKAKGAVRAAVRYIRQTPRLRIAYVMLIVIGALGFNFSVQLPLFVERSLGGGDGEYTALYVVFSIGAMAGSLVVAQRQLVHLRHVVIGAAAFGAMLILLASMPSLAGAIPMALLLGASSILYSTATTAIAQVDTDPQYHGRILALQTVLLVGTAPIGGPIDGILADAFGARVPLVLGGVAALAAALWGWLAARRSHAFDPVRPIEEQLEARSAP
jgi:MFS family permease